MVKIFVLLMFKVYYYSILVTNLNEFKLSTIPSHTLNIYVCPQLRLIVECNRKSMQYLRDKHIYIVYTTLYIYT